jgi:hypothetical protein
MQRADSKIILTRRVRLNALKALLMSTAHMAERLAGFVWLKPIANWQKGSGAGVQCGKPMLGFVLRLSCSDLKKEQLFEDLHCGAQEQDWTVRCTVTSRLSCLQNWHYHSCLPDGWKVSIVD